MLHCSWDMICNKCNYFLFWAIFLPFYNPKNQTFKKMKKSLKISSFYTCAPKIMITWCTAPEIWCAIDARTDGWTEKVTYRGGKNNKNSKNNFTEVIHLNIFLDVNLILETSLRHLGHVIYFHTNKDTIILNSYSQFLLKFWFGLWYTLQECLIRSWLNQNISWHLFHSCTP